MAPRALGALLALVAALAFAWALAGGALPKLVPGWWDGHPRVSGEMFERKDIRVGLFSAYGCNLGEQVTCQELDSDSQRLPVGYAELALLVLVLATTGTLTWSLWKIGDHRKLLGKLVLVEVALVAAGGAMILVLGPELKITQRVEVPIGLGMIVFWGGTIAAAVASVVAIRIEPEPLRLKASVPRLEHLPSASSPTLPAPEPHFDVRELLRDHEGARPGVPSPGGNLPGLSGPLVPQPSPLFDHAPHLRPLYDPNNAGLVPAPSTPPLPLNLPTPMSRSAIGALMGIPTPPPLEPVTPPQPPAALPVPSGPRTAPASVPPPPGRLPPLPPRPNKPSVPQPPKFPTISHVVPPPPTTANQPPPSVLAARDSSVKISADTEDRPTLAHATADPITAVEIDAEAKARAKVALDNTDRAVPAPATATDENPTVAAPPPSDRGSEQNLTVPRPRESAGSMDNLTVPRPRESIGSMQTIARPKQDPEDLNETIERDPKRPSTPPNGGMNPPERLSTEDVKVPISTAPSTLPPPKKSAATTSGPTPACPQCEAPMAWVEEHLRFYCAQCRMYF